MAAERDLVCLMTPDHLELHQAVRNGSGSARYHEVSRLDLPISVLDVSLTMIPIPSNICGTSRPLCMLRLCVACEEGLFVYDVSMTADHRSSMQQVWTSRSDDRFSKSRPFFGRSASSVSWLNAVNSKPWTDVAFATTSILAPSASTESTKPPTYEIKDAAMPALYCAGVCDYDESLGLFVAGSGHGELALYSLCAYDAPMLEGCLRSVPMPGAGDYKLLATGCKLRETTKAALTHSR